MLGERKNMKKLVVKYLNFIYELFLKEFIEENKIASKRKRLLLRICLLGIFLILLIGIFEQVMKINENNNDFVDAVDKYYQGNYQNAKKSIEKSIIVNNNQNIIIEHYIRGSINYKLNRYYDALKDLSIVSGSNQEYFLDVRKKFFFSSDKFFTMNKQPIFIETCLMKSQCKMKLKDYRGALLDAKIGIDTIIKYQNVYDKNYINEKYISLKYVSGCGNFKINKFEQALFLFNEIIKSGKEHSFPNVYIYKGLIAQMKKDKDSACLFFSRAGELGEASAYGYINKWCK